MDGNMETRRISNTIYSRVEYEIPILFVFFNRYDVALQSFQKIKDIKPKKLYLACDGPRANVAGEDEKVENTRKAILEQINWDCNIKTLFQEKNIGCGRGVFTAINWLFENEEYGIILEDDCIASPSFFRYAEEMLVKYKNDMRIGMIAGHNSITNIEYPYSYIFSRYKSCWGWATWRRAWENMNFDMSWRDTKLANSVINNMGDIGRDVSGWKFKINAIDNNFVSAWDWQWYFSLSAQNQLCIYPALNQISNIGNDKEATHTSFSNITIPISELKFPLIAPPYIVPYYEFDKAFYLKSTSFRVKATRLLPKGLKNLIKSIITNLGNAHNQKFNSQD